MTSETQHVLHAGQDSEGSCSAGQAGEALQQRHGLCRANQPRTCSVRAARAEQQPHDLRSARLQHLDLMPPPSAVTFLASVARMVAESVQMEGRAYRHGMQAVSAKVQRPQPLQHACMAGLQVVSTMHVCDSCDREQQCCLPLQVQTGDPSWNLPSKMRRRSRSGESCRNVRSAKVVLGPCCCTRSAR